MLFINWIQEIQKNLHHYLTQNPFIIFPFLHLEITRTHAELSHCSNAVTQIKLWDSETVL